MKLKLTLTLLIVLTLSACAPEPPLSDPNTGAANPMLIPALTAAAQMTAQQLATYVDDKFRFAFNYPSAWMLDVIALGDRAPHSIQLTSWTHEPGIISETPPGGTVMNVVVQLWEPKGDLAAFVAQRMDDWKASNIAIVSQEEIRLADGRTAQEFVVQSGDEESYFLFALLGDQYLVFSGSGDIEAVRQAARSLR